MQRKLGCMCSVTLRGRFLGIPTLKEMTSLAETGLSFGPTWNSCGCTSLPCVAVYLYDELALCKSQISWWRKWIWCIMLVTIVTSIIHQIHKNGRHAENLGLSTRAKHFRTDRIFVHGFLPSRRTRNIVLAKSNPMLPRTHVPPDLFHSSAIMNLVHGNQAHELKIIHLQIFPT